MRFNMFNDSWKGNICEREETSYVKPPTAC